jgi:hypothetical protein
LRELTNKYKQLIFDYGLESWVSKDFDFKEFVKGLSSIQSMPLCDGCLQGDGNPDCRMRSCAKDRGHSECIECDHQDICENRDNLEAMRNGAVKAGLIVKIDKVDCKEFIDCQALELKKNGYQE